MFPADEPVFLVYDNARPHVRAQLPAGINQLIQLKRLPPYSPFLNMTEMAHSSFKAGVKRDLALPEWQLRVGDRDRNHNLPAERASDGKRERPGLHQDGISDQTVRNRLRAANLRCRRPYRGPILTNDRQQRRLQWVNRHQVLRFFFWLVCIYIEPLWLDRHSTFWSCLDFLILMWPLY